jgi:hypothetical protein
MLSAPAHAIDLALEPSETTVAVGSSFSVDVVVDDLDASDEIVSGFDLTIDFDPSLVRVAGVAIATDPGNELVEQAVIGPGATAGGVSQPLGRVNLAAISLLGDTELAAAQGDRVVLATLAMDALAPGTATLELVPDEVPGVVGNDVMGTESADSEPSVLELASAGSANIVVPEPAIGMLHGLALALVGALARGRIR